METIFSQVPWSQLSAAMKLSGSSGDLTHRIYWHSSGSWQPRGFPGLLHNSNNSEAPALPKVWWILAQAAPLADSLEEKVEEEKHICVFSWTTQPWSQSLFTPIYYLKRGKEKYGITCFSWFAVTGRILVTHAWPCPVAVLHFNLWHPSLALWPIQIPPSPPIFPLQSPLRLPNTSEYQHFWGKKSILQKAVAISSSSNTAQFSTQINSDT